MMWLRSGPEALAQQVKRRWPHQDDVQSLAECAPLWIFWLAFRDEHSDDIAIRPRGQRVSVPQNLPEPEPELGLLVGVGRALYLGNP